MNGLGNRGRERGRPTPMSVTRRRVAVIAGALVALVLAVAVAAWSGTRSIGTNDAGWLDSLDDVQGVWVSTAGHAADGTTPWTVPVSLWVDGDDLRLRADCNHIGATVEIRDHRLYADGGAVMTEMGCDPERHATDAWLAALIEQHATIQLKGPTLMLDTDAGWIGFERGPALPTTGVTDPDAPVSSTP